MCYFMWGEGLGTGTLTQLKKLCVYNDTDALISGMMHSVYKLRWSIDVHVKNTFKKISLMRFYKARHKKIYFEK